MHFLLAGTAEGEGLSSRAPVDMEKIAKIIELCPKRWMVRVSCFRRILENYAVLMEEWDVFLSERLQPDVRARIIFLLFASWRAAL